ncbi:hypothetical protein LTR74_000108 [Friedmanniomyces endolithicus]|nr:hypothetical protein LTR74_000108 [Friedmanniomyces endolithicus]
MILTLPASKSGADKARQVVKHSNNHEAAAEREKCEHAVERDEAKPARGGPAQEDREDFEKNLALTRKRLEDWNERCSALEKMARLAADEVRRRGRSFSFTATGLATCGS